MKTKYRNLQPWLDYFRMLQEYERNGYLEIGRHDKATDSTVTNEAYVTRSALMTLTGVTPEPDDYPGENKTWWRMLKEIPKVMRRIRTYAGWRSQEGESFLGRPFALNVVKDDEPHDLFCTIVLTTKRRWWKLWMKTDCFDVIPY